MQGYRQTNMVACQRCGRMSEPAGCYYDLAGALVCRACHAQQIVAIGDARVAEAQIEQRRSGWGPGRLIWIAVVIGLALVRACLRHG